MEIKRLLSKSFKWIFPCVIGITIGIVISLLKGDNSFDNVLAKFTTHWKEMTWLFIAIFLGAYIGSILQIIVHEAGHLVFGLYSGYKFVSFRVLNFTIIKEGDKFRIKRFGLSGTGGQCLLSPPDCPIEKIPVVLYNLGGIIFNLLFITLCIAVNYFSDNVYVRMVMVIMIIIGIALILSNGIPLTINGMPNDGHNALYLNKNTHTKAILSNLLSLNALIQDGMRPCDVSDTYFQPLEDADLSKPMDSNLALFHITTLVDRGETDKAINLCKQINDKSKVELFKKDVKVKLATILFTKGNETEAKNLLSKNDLQYFNDYRKSQPSMQCLLCLYALYAEHDRAKATALYEDMKANKDKFLIKGETTMFLDIMNKELRSLSKEAQTTS